jgi:5-methylcytosine-specific restriction endonuclease McrA
LHAQTQTEKVIIVTDAVLNMKSLLLRQHRMKCQRCGAEIGLNDSELCKTDPNGKFTEDNLRIYCRECADRHLQTIRGASRPSRG